MTLTPGVDSVLCSKLTSVRNRTVCKSASSWSGAGCHACAWQVSGGSDTTYEQRVELDTYCIRNRKIWIDIYTLIKTVGVVFKREGAY